MVYLFSTVASGFYTRRLRRGSQRVVAECRSFDGLMMWPVLMLCLRLVDVDTRCYITTSQTVGFVRCCWPFILIANDVRRNCKMPSRPQVSGEISSEGCDLLALPAQCCCYVEPPSKVKPKFVIPRAVILLFSNDRAFIYDTCRPDARRLQRDTFLQLRRSMKSYLITSI